MSLRAALTLITLTEDQSFSFFTVQVATRVNSSAGQTLSNAVSLNSSTAELADEVATATSEVNALDQAVANDKEAIAIVTCVANDTIILAVDVQERIIQINVSNFSRPLNLKIPNGQLCLVPQTLLSLAPVENKGLQGRFYRILSKGYA